MSDDQNKPPPYVNPYSRPFAPTSSQPPLNAQTPTPGNPLIAPAICLLVVGIFSLLWSLVMLPIQIMEVSMVDTSTPEGIGEVIGGVGVWTLMFLSNVIVVAGAIAMIRYRGYVFAFTASIVAMIPCCSPCMFLGIPFGIWSMVVLTQPDVKSRFR